MEKIWEFFRNMNELVYVSDMDTYEVIWMNKKALDVYGHDSLDEVVGKKCYEVLQHCQNPCAVCNNQDLQPGYFKEWQYYNPVLQRHTVLKNTMVEDDGRRCRVEIALDASTQEWKNSTRCNNNENLEAIVNEGLRVALHAATPDKSLEVILEYLGEAQNGDRAYIFERNEQGGHDNTYEWVANGVRPEKDNLQNVPYEVCSSWYRNFRENRYIMIENIENLRDSDPMLYEVLKRQDIQTLVVVPLYENGEVIGFFGVDNTPVERMEYASDMLQIMGHFIISTIRRRNLFKELREMSYCDQLTGIGNRHAMQHYISQIQKNKSIGVVYGDITGLKRVNDEQGHEAGDRLIACASESMHRVFGDYGVFRIGGDEFLALCSGIEQTELEKRVERLHADMEENSVKIAIGVVWNPEGTAGMDALLTESEQRMYEDKSAYYKATGINRRR